VYRCLHGSAPGYLASDLQRVSDLGARRRLRSSSIRQLLSLHVPCVLPSATEPSRRMLHLSGTVCRRQYGHRRHCQFSAVDWRLNFLLVLQLNWQENVSLHWLLRDPTITVRCPCSPRTYATLKYIRSSSSSSSSLRIFHTNGKVGDKTRVFDYGEVRALRKCAKRLGRRQTTGNGDIDLWCQSFHFRLSIVIVIT